MRASRFGVIMVYVRCPHCNETNYLDDYAVTESSDKKRTCEWCHKSFYYKLSVDVTVKTGRAEMASELGL